MAESRVADGNAVIYAFDDFELDDQRRTLRRGGEPVSIRARVFALPLHLVQRRGRVVTREALLRAVWADSVESAAALSRGVNQARGAIEDEGDRQRRLRTLHGEGFSFMRTLPLFLLLASLPASVALANGNVETERTNDGITIKGDAGDNEFEVTYGTNTNGDDVLVVTGKNGTTVNGQESFEVSLPEGGLRVNKILVEDDGGTDTVTIDLQGLPDAKRMDDVEVGDSENVTLRNLDLGAGGKLKVDRGTNATVEACDTDNLNLDTFGEVVIRNCNVTGKAKLSDQSADGSLTIEDCFFDSAKARIRVRGSTNIQPPRSTRIRRTTGRKMSLSSRGVMDDVAFEDVMFDSLAVGLGDGDDLVSFTGSTVYELGVDGGKGDDCFDDMQDQNVFASFKPKGFEPGACNGAAPLEWFDFGAEPLDEFPEDAVAWRVRNPEIGHGDGPFALPGHGAVLGLPERGPLDVAPAHWADPDLCDWVHLHGDFEGHEDPAPGPPDSESACGHGALEYGRLAPI